jgi:hypothetical protein
MDRVTQFALLAFRFPLLDLRAPDNNSNSDHRADSQDDPQLLGKQHRVIHGRPKILKGVSSTQCKFSAAVFTSMLIERG